MTTKISHDETVPPPGYVVTDHAWANPSADTYGKCRAWTYESALSDAWLDYKSRSPAKK